jgi:hypothetical protein
MPNVIPFPNIRVEMPVSEAFAMVQLLIALAENLDDHEYKRLRPSMTDQLYLVLDKIDAAAKAIPFSHGAAS